MRHRAGNPCKPVGHWRCGPLRAKPTKKMIVLTPDDRLLNAD